MKLSVKTTLIITILFIFTAHISSQTIHRDDLKNLQFSLLITEKSSPPMLDHSKIADWRFTQNIYKRDSIVWNFNDDFVWFNLNSPDSLQNGVIQHHGISNNFDNKLYNKEFYAGREISDWETARSILTMWERVNDDSITFISSFPINGYSWVKFVSIFPDSSYLIYLESREADGGDVWDSFSFYKQLNDSSFQRFYSHLEEWSAISFNETIKKITFDLSNIRNDNFQIFQENKYYHLINLSTNQDVRQSGKITDSINIEPINIWELAKKHFNIVEP